MVFFQSNPDLKIFIAITIPIEKPIRSNQTLIKIRMNCFRIVKEYCRFRAGKSVASALLRDPTGDKTWRKRINIQHSSDIFTATGMTSGRLSVRKYV